MSAICLVGSEFPLMCLPSEEHYIHMEEEKKYYRVFKYNFVIFKRTLIVTIENYGQIKIVNNITHPV